MHISGLHKLADDFFARWTQVLLDLEEDTRTGPALKLLNLDLKTTSLAVKVGFVWSFWGGSRRVRQHKGLWNIVDMCSGRWFKEGNMWGGSFGSGRLVSAFFYKYLILARRWMDAWHTFCSFQ